MADLSPTTSLLEGLFHGRHARVVVVLRAIVTRKHGTRAQRHTLDLLLKQVPLVQKQDDSSLLEPVGIAGICVHVCFV